MNGWQYLLLVNVYLVLFYGFYALLLRKETFFQLNRIYLVCASALSFFIPMIQAGWVQNLFITQEVHYVVYGQQITISQLQPVAEVPMSIGDILMWLYFAGVIYLVIRLIWQLIVLNRIIKTDQQGVAYSFFKTIKVDETNNNVINAHEQVHARQWHSADVFIIEAVMIINWFNPIVYFYRRAIKHVHEFIADSHAINVADSRAEYAMLLLTQTFETPTHDLVSHFFNHSLLKQRIIMLQKNKSQRVKLLKYGLSAPLFVVMLVLSSATAGNSKTINAINDKITNVLLLPPAATNPFKQEPEKAITNDQTQKLSADTSHKSNAQVFAAVEKEPGFPGGQDKFVQFLSDNIKYPQDMLASGTSGRVIATFVVEADGSLSGIRILRSPAQSASDEATRVLSLSPKWNPGYQNNKAVRVQFTVPIAFNPGINVIGYKSKTDTVKNPINLTLSPPYKIDAIYIVDGKELSDADAKAFLKTSNNIMSVNIKKDPSNRTKGIIEITTTENKDVTYFADGKKVSATEAHALNNADNAVSYRKDPSNPDKSIVEIITNPNKDAIYFVDDKEVSKDDAKAIIKSQAFFAMYPKQDASNPDKKVIEILTKKPADVTLDQQGKNEPIYIIDGIEAKPDVFKTIDPKDIESISVIKGNSAEAQYGTKAKNGVVVITMKGHSGNAPKPSPLAPPSPDGK